MIHDGHLHFRWNTHAGSAPDHVSLGDVDAVIIHQGVLDRIERETGFPATALYDDLRKNIPFVVVDSGRGTPPGLPGIARFLPFSLLQHYANGSHPAKFSFSQVLMSLSRRSANIETPWPADDTSLS
jgi:hypothetical protein